MKPFQLAALAALLTFAAQPAAAHRIWVYPSASVLSGDGAWVTFDAAVSNNLFFADHVALDPKDFTAIGPDGKPAELQNANKGKYRSTFDLELTKPGTYRVFTLRENVMASWEEGGEKKSFRGSAAAAKEAGVASKPGVKITENFSRVETFVTAGEPTKEALAPTGKGMEIVFAKTHPTDLVANDKAAFVLHVDGKPAAGVTITTIKGDDRYRSQVGEITATTNEQGEFEVTWPEAGRWWLNASISTEAQGDKPGKRAGYTAVFEVLPE